MSTTASTTAPAHTAGERQPLYAALVGVSSLFVLLQGLWAGLFLQPDASSRWIEVHARGGEVAIAFAALATLVAFVRSRARRDLWIGSAALTVLLLLEAFLGGRIAEEGNVGLTAVHVPLAMALMALSVWLPLRAGRRA